MCEPYRFQPPPRRRAGRAASDPIRSLKERCMMTQIRGKLLASVAGLVVGFAAGGASADQLLTGSITSASCQKLEGVQGSAKKEGATITTSVYTDQKRDYFFPPLADGQYQMFAQAL